MAPLWVISPRLKYLLPFLSKEIPFVSYNIFYFIFYQPYRRIFSHTRITTFNTSTSSIAMTKILDFGVLQIYCTSLLNFFTSLAKSSLGKNVNITLMYLLSFSSRATKLKSSANCRWRHCRQLVCV